MNALSSRSSKQTYIFQTCWTSSGQCSNGQSSKRIFGKAHSATESFQPPMPTYCMRLTLTCVSCRLALYSHQFLTRNPRGLNLMAVFLEIWHRTGPSVFG